MTSSIRSGYFLTKRRRSILPISSSSDDKWRDRIFILECQRQRLVVNEHETMLHIDRSTVYHELSRKIYWSNMINQIKMICKACEPCQTAKVRRQQLSAAFEQADKEELPPLNIDFYGHTQGDILVTLDLFTREPSLWFLPYRKMISLIIRQWRI